MKSPSRRLSQPRDPAAWRARGPISPSPKVTTSHMTAATARLVSGPTTAIRNSSRGRGASIFILLTPPKRKRVMPSTPIPRRCAITEWLISCNSTDAKNTTVVMPAAARRAGPDASVKTFWNWT